MIPIKASDLAKLLTGQEGGACGCPDCNPQAEGPVLRQRVAEAIQKHAKALERLRGIEAFLEEHPEYEAMEDRVRAMMKEYMEN